MGSVSEDMVEPSLIGTSGMKFRRWESQNGQGQGISGVCYSLISVSLKLGGEYHPERYKPMATRNEVTARILSKQGLRVGANHKLRVGEIWEEANALGNARDMLTSQR